MNKKRDRQSDTSRLLSFNYLWIVHSRTWATARCGSITEVRVVLKYPQSTVENIQGAANVHISRALKFDDCEPRPRRKLTKCTGY
jgi:hypothetical protein